MKTNPIVSIVLPTYNGIRYLDQVIQSCLDQNFEAWELIIVDDASTDDTPSKIAEYLEKDNRIKLVRHDTNRKLPAALNTGFAIANGLFHTWTSDDNLYRPKALMVMVRFLETHPNTDVVYTDFSVIDEDNHLIKRVEVSPPTELIRGNCIGPCFLWRGHIKEEIGPYAENLFLAEDYDFWLRVSIRFNMTPLHQDLYSYRWHRESLTSANDAQVLTVTEKAFTRNCPFLNWANSDEKSEAYVSFARKAFNQENLRGALKYIVKAVKYSPSFVFQYFMSGLSKSLKRRNVLTTQR
jgi:glycosyltransferase involved in cell wall biosynthesis